MKRIAIIFLALAMICTLSGCSFGSANRKDPNDEPTIPVVTEPTTKPDECVEHDFTDGSLLFPRSCRKCDATEGEPLYKQCETWEDVFACLYFGELSYDLTVTEAEDCVTLVLEFTDANQFSTEDLIKEFMVKAFLSLPDIIGLTQGDYLGMSIDTPGYFKKDATIFLAIPGAIIGCVPYDGNIFGIATCLIPDEGVTNLTVIESAYNTAFGSTNAKYEFE